MQSLITRFVYFLDQSYELSSDDGEERYPNYDNPKDKFDYLFYEAENLGGRSYANYKSKIMKDFNACDSFDSDEETF